MNLQDIDKKLNQIQSNSTDFSFTINSGLSDSDIENIQTKIGKQIPNKIKKFYSSINGLKTSNPDFEILPIEKWNSAESDLIHFATFDKDLKAYFDTKELNQADSWSIINPKDNYVLTLTMSSFWSNKIWHWIEKKREIWKDEFWK